ncbi:unnamed protein product [Larinioides sclopetarius]|uniref:Uncharacterized protein n=1 Tax=Larinioides sclopetarius TaxID=280406 RepID=A0AAV1ZVA8_9ARAC
MGLGKPDSYSIPAQSPEEGTLTFWTTSGKDFIQNPTSICRTEHHLIDFSPYLLNVIVKGHLVKTTATLTKPRRHRISRELHPFILSIYKSGDQATSVQSVPLSLVIMTTTITTSRIYKVCEEQCLIIALLSPA